MEVAPRSTDPFQQTVATLLQNYLNHPDVNRWEAIELIRTLNQADVQRPSRRTSQGVTRLFKGTKR